MTDKPAHPPLPEPAAHMLTEALEAFKTAEMTAPAFSVAVSTPDNGRSEPLFTAHQMHAYRDASAWLPIETIPTTEAVSLIVLRRGVCVQVSWFEGRLYPDAREACIDWADGITDATHWMYAPANPGAPIEQPGEKA